MVMLMTNPVLYRRRLIPEECILLKDDVILRNDPGILVTGWHALKPRKDLHHGFSCYYPEKGYKISRFYARDGRLLYHYCDIIDCEYDDAAGSLIVTDLLADVIVYPDGFVKVVDLDEIPEALDRGLLSSLLLKKTLFSLNLLLTQIYDGDLAALTAPMDPFDPASLAISKRSPL